MDPVTAAYLFQMGFNTVAAWWHARQADKAAGRQIDQSKEARALEEYYYQQEQERADQDRAESQRRYDQQTAEEQRRYEQKAIDNAPYLRLGRGALSKLAFGVGIDDPTDSSGGILTGPNGKPMTPGMRTSTPTPTDPWNGTAGPGMGFQGGTLASLAAPGTPQAANQSPGSMVTVRTPQGTHVLVPFAQLNDALANGGTRV